MVLGRGAEEGDAADVDLFDSLGDRRRRDAGDGLVERVQVADDDVDRGDLLGVEVGRVGGDVAGEDAWRGGSYFSPRSFKRALRREEELTAVDGGVEGLDSSAEHLRSLGDVRDIPAVARVSFVLAYYEP